MLRYNLILCKCVLQECLSPITIIDDYENKTAIFKVIEQQRIVLTDKLNSSYKDALNSECLRLYKEYIRKRADDIIYLGEDGGDSGDYDELLLKVLDQSMSENRFSCLFCGECSDESRKKVEGKTPQDRILFVSRIGNNSISDCIGRVCDGFRIKTKRSDNICDYITWIWACFQGENNVHIFDRYILSDAGHRNQLEEFYIKNMTTGSRLSIYVDELTIGNQIEYQLIKKWVIELEKRYDININIWRSKDIYDSNHNRIPGAEHGRYIYLKNHRISIDVGLDFLYLDKRIRPTAIRLDALQLGECASEVKKLQKGYKKIFPMEKT